MSRDYQPKHGMQGKARNLGERSDMELAKACLAQNRQAQQELYERFRLPLFRLCLRYARDKQEAEDFLHDGLITIFRDLNKYRGEGPLGGWCRRVVLNVSLQHLRKRKKMVEVELTEAPELSTESDDMFFEGKPDPKLLIQFLQQLPDGYRTVFNLYVIENYNHREIAEQLGISIGSSKSQLHKAKAMLRRLAAPIFAADGNS